MPPNTPPSRSPSSANRDAEGVESLLRAILERLDNIERALERLPSAPRSQRAVDADVELVRAIAGVMRADTPFPAWEVIALAEDRALQHSRLRAAIHAVVGGVDALRLGKALQRMAGANLGGLVVTREGEERGAAVWSVRESRE